MTARLLLAATLCAALCLAGCAKSPDTNSSGAGPSPHEIARAANHVFLSQKTFDPWVLTGAVSPVPAYISDGKSSVAATFSKAGVSEQVFHAGYYKNGQLQATSRPLNNPFPSATYTLNMKVGTLSTGVEPQFNVAQDTHNWPALWAASDVKIDGDPEAQQVTHANLFYLLSSTYHGSRHSLPPLGLSSTVYGGHIFWDAELWMFPALVIQHPDYARSIIDYRFDRLAQAKANAKAHGFAGAEYPWESADTGKEVAPAEFAQERHVTADVAWAAWRYYLWTGDRHYLQTEGWPILEACADYWVSRVTRGKDAKYHILHVLGPDETAGAVDDDAFTGGVVRVTLDAAVRAAHLLGTPANPAWQQVHDSLAVPTDTQRGIPQSSAAPMTDRFAAKQADALLLLHPLNTPIDTATQGRMLDFYSTHTIKNGPAMTDAIHAIVAARLGRDAQALAFFHDSYRPFERGPWDAFSEKRTTNNVYFLTGMGGCVQSVLFGFAGLNIAVAGQTGRGQKIAGDGVASLYASPRLPPGWTGLTVQGIRFRGRTLSLTLRAGNRVSVQTTLTTPPKKDALTRHSQSLMPPSPAGGRGLGTAPLAPLLPACGKGGRG